MYILKPSFYDEFRCLADKCGYTCCRDWNIIVDAETFVKNRAIYERYLTEEEGKDEKVIRLKKDGRCSFLDEKGLCSLIAEHGEEVLCHTCESFPRFTLKRQGVTEQALSNGCPAVLQFLNVLPVPLSFVMEEGDDVKGLECANLDEEIIKCREQVIDLLQIQDFPLWMRFYIVYQFTKKIDGASGEDVSFYINQYNSVSYLLELGQQLAKLNCDYTFKIKSSFELFVSINKAFKNYLGYQKYIDKLLQYICGLQVERLVPAYRDFEGIYDEKEQFFENFSVNYVFKNVLKEQEDRNFHRNILILLIEITMIKFTIFLQWLYKEKDITDKEIMEIACYYARLIEHNFEKMYCFMDGIQEDGWFEAGRMFELLR